MKTVIALVFSMSIFMLHAQKQLELSDFEVLKNSKWQGTLTYKNYRDGKLVTLKCNMQIQIENERIIYSVQYPNEPEANSVLKKKIRKNGTHFGKDRVLEVSKLNNGFTKIMTSFKGKDNNRKATMYMIYMFNDQEISIEKQVKYHGTVEKFTRNKQSYKRM